MNPDLEIIAWNEKEDGSSVLIVEMNFDMLVVFARRGMQAMVEEVAAEHGYPVTEGDGNEGPRDGRDSELFGEIPGL